MLQLLQHILADTPIFMYPGHLGYFVEAFALIYSRVCCRVEFERSEIESRSRASPRRPPRSVQMNTIKGRNKFAASISLRVRPIYERTYGERIAGTHLPGRPAVSPPSCLPAGVVIRREVWNLRGKHVPAIKYTNS